MHVKNTPETVVFLRSVLSRFLAWHSRTGEWNKLRIADYITATLDISGSLSDTTLGRFLDKNHKQKPGLSTIRMIAEFLLAQKVINAEHLEYTRHPLFASLSLNMADFFKSSGSETTFQDSYLVNSVSCDHFTLESHLVLVFDRQENAVSLSERLLLYRTENIGGRVITECISTVSLCGTGVITSCGPALFFLQSQSPEYPSLLVTIDRIITEDENTSIITGIAGQRHHEWARAKTGQIIRKPRIKDDTPPDLVMKILAGDVNYNIMNYSTLDKTGKSRIIPSTLKKDSRHFVDTTGNLGNCSMADSSSQNIFSKKADADSKSATEALFSAIRNNSFEQFRQSLEDGVSPDCIDPSMNEPLLFRLVHDLKTEWIRYLADHTDADFLCYDSKGMPAEYYPLLWAEQFHANQDHVLMYQEIADIITDAVEKQLKKRDTFPVPDLSV